MGGNKVGIDSEEEVAVCSFEELLQTFQQSQSSIESLAKSKDPFALWGLVKLSLKNEGSGRIHPSIFSFSAYPDSGHW